MAKTTSSAGNNSVLSFREVKKNIQEVKTGNNTLGDDFRLISPLVETDDIFTQADAVSKARVSGELDRQVDEEKAREVEKFPELSVDNIDPMRLEGMSANTIPIGSTNIATTSPLEDISLIDNMPPNPMKDSDYTLKLKEDPYNNFIATKTMDNKLRLSPPGEFENTAIASDSESEIKKEEFESKYSTEEKTASGDETIRYAELHGERIDWEIDEDVRKSTLERAIEDVKLNKFGKLLQGDMQTVLYNKYNRHNVVNVGFHNGFRKAHVFITVPCCNLFGDFETGVGVNYDSNKNPTGLPSTIIKAKLPELYDFLVTENNLELARFLDREGCYGADGTRPGFDKKPVFMFPLMNLLKSISTMPNYEMKTRESPRNMRGNFAELAVDTTDSLSSQSFTTVFEDDRYCTASRILYILMKYMDAVNQGIIPPKNNSTKYGYIDYDMSFFVFVTDETGINIVNWHKLTSCFPKERNYSHLNIQRIMKDRNEISVSWKMTIPSDYGIYDLLEFNYLSLVMKNMTSNLKSLRIPNIEEQVLAYRDPNLLSVDDFYPDTFFVLLADRNAADKTEEERARDVVISPSLIQKSDYHKLIMFSSDRDTKETLENRNTIIGEMVKHIHKKVVVKW